jgi:hypothetical protein
VVGGGGQPTTQARRERARGVSRGGEPSTIGGETTSTRCRSTGLFAEMRGARSCVLMGHFQSPRQYAVGPAL